MKKRKYNLLDIIENNSNKDNKIDYYRELCNKKDNMINQLKCDNNCHLKLIYNINKQNIININKYSENIEMWKIYSLSIASQCVFNVDNITLDLLCSKINHNTTQNTEIYGYSISTIWRILLLINNASVNKLPKPIIKNIICYLYLEAIKDKIKI